MQLLPCCCFCWLPRAVELMHQRAEWHGACLQECRLAASVLCAVFLACPSGRASGSLELGSQQSTAHGRRTEWRSRAASAGANFSTGQQCSSSRVSEQHILAGARQRGAGEPNAGALRQPLSLPQACSVLSLTALSGTLGPDGWLGSKALS